MNISLPVTSISLWTYLSLDCNVLAPIGPSEPRVRVPVHIERREDPVAEAPGAERWAGPFFSIIFLGGIIY